MYDALYNVMLGFFPQGSVKLSFVNRGSFGKSQIVYKGSFDDIVEHIGELGKLYDQTLSVEYKHATIRTKPRFLTNGQVDYEKIGWFIVSKQVIISEKNITKYFQNFDFAIISESQNLSENFIRKFKNYGLDWSAISSNQNLSEEFIDEMNKYVDWKNITKYQQKNLSWKFIEKYKHHMDWFIISSQYKLTEKKIEKYYDFIDWHKISARPILSEAFLRKHINKFNLFEICKNQKVSSQFITEYADKMDCGKGWQLDCWLACSFNQRIKKDEKFIEDFNDELDWQGLIMNQKISDELMLKYKHKIKSDYLNSSQHVSKAFKKKHLDKFERSN